MKRTYVDLVLVSKLLAFKSTASLRGVKKGSYSFYSNIFILQSPILLGVILFQSFYFLKTMSRLLYKPM